MPLLLVGADTRRVLFYQSAEHHALEHREDQRGQQKAPHAQIVGIGQNADPQDIEARRAPHKARQQQQCISFYHRIPLF